MSREATTSKEPIHSGHFMTSNPHEVKNEDEEDFEVDVVDVDDSMTETDTSHHHAKISRPDKDEKPVTFYKFGPEKTQSIAIDVSLNKLKKCINVAYMKLTTPKWKDFKGLKLQWKHRIRLNNVIWRAYYMEFRKPDKKKKYCYFTVPDDDTTHTKIEGTVLEGMYWKRRMEAVCAQYKRWRTFNRPAKKKTSKCCRKRDDSCSCLPNDVNRPNQSRTPLNMSTYDSVLLDVDEFDNEFTNSLFESLNMPFMFPNPKEFSNDQMANADYMQPCLLSLQPSIEEINGADPFAHQHIMQQQQQQQQQQPQMMNGNIQQNTPQQPYRADKGYEGNAALLDYKFNSLQPTRQSSAIISNGLISAQNAQPLYSRALYDSMTPLHASPQPFSNEENPGRASSTLSFGAPTPQPYMPAQIIPAVSGGTLLQSLPNSTLVNSQIRATSPFQSHDTFRNRFIAENNPQSLHQQQQQFWINTMQQQQQQYNNLDRRTIQILQSPNPNSPMNMGNNGISFGSPNSLINLSAASPSLTNFIQNQHNIMANQPTQIMQNVASPVLHRYLTNNTLNQPQQQTNSLPGLLGKPNGLNAYVPEQNLFSQVKMEKQFHHQMIPRSPNRSDLYRSIPNSAGDPSTSENLPQNTIFPTSDNRPTIFRNDDHQTSNAEPQQSTAFPATTRFHRKRAAHSMSNRGSPSYTQAASTSSSDAMLSDSETTVDEKLGEVRTKRRTNSIRSEVESNLLPDERKRILHLNAEKNRRNALKDGFETLTSVIPVIDEAGVKPTNAVVLNRAANFIRTLKNESDNRKKDLENCKERIEKMNARITMLQSNLPSSSCRTQGSTTNANLQTQIEQSFEKHVKDRARQDYRYWLMAQMIKPLIMNYAKTVHADSEQIDRIIESTQIWLSRNWNVTELRPLASKMLIFLATEVNVLKNSAALPDHVQKEINKAS
uniref:BHLH domain-containing protein n=1 Tax=Panagrolaimus sp. JU765 TaxID=591449 RepID=A0AC34R374_9BILA